MTTRSNLNNRPQVAADYAEPAAGLPDPSPDEVMLNRMANAFFAAWPNAVSSAPHHPQPAEPLAAFNHRLPNIADQKSLNPDLPEHIPNYPDHPERRGMASMPVVGGANLPKAPFEPQLPQVRDQIVTAPQAEPIAAASTASPAKQATTPEATTALATGYYFIDELQAPRPDTDHGIASNPSTVSDLTVTHDFLDLPNFASAATQPSAPPHSSHTDPHPHSHSHTDQRSNPQLPHAQQALNQVFDVHRIRQDFPILSQRIHGQPLIWLDNAATTQKPQQVIDRISHFYQYENSNIHRAAHELAARATDAYEHARKVVARFIGADSADEIIFVRGATEGINLIAKTWGVQNIQAGDEILVSQLEHHANIVPWYQLCQQTGAKLKVIPVDDSGQIILQQLPSLLTARTKLVSLTQVSNALGTITPVAEVIEMAHAKNIRVLVDAAQSVSHMPTQVRGIDADFLVFSGHKVFAPTGIGVVYAKAELLESMPVWQGGGNMIEDVRFEHVIYQAAPQKFEAGTGNIADAVGLGAALEYVESIGIDQIARYEHELLQYAQNALRSVPGLRLIGTALNKASVMSFVLHGYQPEQVGQALNRQGIAVRAGHHCAQPILRRFGVEKTVRPSLAFYNTYEEIDILVSALHQLTRQQQSF